jgi:putative redox protein
VEGGMISETVRADWIEDQVFLLRDRFGFPVVMTRPQGVNGADLLPLSLIGCAAWDILSILHKQHQAIDGFEVLARSERDPDPPWRFRCIRITYRFRGPNLCAASIQRALKLTETKYCSTYATLRDAVEITSTYEIVNESG